MLPKLRIDERTRVQDEPVPIDVVNHPGGQLFSQKSRRVAGHTEALLKKLVMGMVDGIVGHRFAFG